MEKSVILSKHRKKILCNTAVKDNNKREDEYYDNSEKIKSLKEYQMK